MLRKIALVLFAITGVSHIIFGIIYVTANEFMSYHSQALSTEWSSLDSNYKILFLALIRLAGAGGLVAGFVNLSLITYSLYRWSTKIIWLLPISALTLQLTTNYVVYSVYTNTPGRPPLMAVSLGTLVLVVGTILFIVGRRGKDA
jgi:hypothetical protein